MDPSTPFGASGMSLRASVSRSAAFRSSVMSNASTVVTAAAKAAAAESAPTAKRSDGLNDYLRRVRRMPEEIKQAMKNTRSIRTALCAVTDTAALATPTGCYLWRCSADVDGAEVYLLQYPPEFAKACELDAYRSEDGMDVDGDGQQPSYDLGLGDDADLYRGAPHVALVPIDHRFALTVLVSPRGGRVLVFPDPLARPVMATLPLFDHADGNEELADDTLVSVTTARDVVLVATTYRLIAMRVDDIGKWTVLQPKPEFSLTSLFSASVAYFGPAAGLLPPAQPAKIIAVATRGRDFLVLTDQRLELWSPPASGDSSTAILVHTAQSGRNVAELVLSDPEPGLPLLPVGTGIVHLAASEDDAGSVLVTVRNPYRAREYLVHAIADAFAKNAFVEAHRIPKTTDPLRTVVRLTPHTSLLVFASGVEAVEAAMQTEFTWKRGHRNLAGAAVALDDHRARLLDPVHGLYEFNLHQFGQRALPPPIDNSHGAFKYDRDAGSPRRGTSVHDMPAAHALRTTVYSLFRPRAGARVPSDTDVQAVLADLVAHIAHSADAAAAVDNAKTQAEYLHHLVYVLREWPHAAGGIEARVGADTRARIWDAVTGAHALIELHVSNFLAPVVAEHGTEFFGAGFRHQVAALAESARARIQAAADADRDHLPAAQDACTAAIRTLGILVAHATRDGTAELAADLEVRGILAEGVFDPAVEVANAVLDGLTSHQLPGLASAKADGEPSPMASPSFLRVVSMLLTEAHKLLDIDVDAARVVTWESVVTAILALAPTLAAEVVTSVGWESHAALFGRILAHEHLPEARDTAARILDMYPAASFPFATAYLAALVATGQHSAALEVGTAHRDAFEAYLASAADVPPLLRAMYLVTTDQAGRALDDLVAVVTTTRSVETGRVALGMLAVAAAESRVGDRYAAFIRVHDAVFAAEARFQDAYLAPKQSDAGAAEVPEHVQRVARNRFRLPVPWLIDGAPLDAIPVLAEILADATANGIDSVTGPDARETWHRLVRRALLVASFVGADGDVVVPADDARVVIDALRGHVAELGLSKHAVIAPDAAAVAHSEAGVWPEGVAGDAAFAAADVVRRAIAERVRGAHFCKLLTDLFPHDRE
ncbi:hypothetical protein H9P43_000963 [Blastocladiella emersonii ATCC 22665]|nr:hypothetical protein H9P43_000963 [Blastocladiella emersonii ATCC 22665]